MRRDCSVAGSRCGGPAGCASAGSGASITPTSPPALMIYSLVFLVTLSAVAVGCAYRIVKNGQLNEPLVEDIKAKVSLHRGLSFVEPVQVEVVKRKKAAQLLRETFDDQYPPKRLIALERAYKRMGLIGPNTDFRRMVLEFYKNNVAGFYDPKRKKLFLVEEVVGRFSIIAFIFQHDASAELVVAHELTHALEDQHFDFEHIEAGIHDNDDALLALNALEEGSATLVGFAVLYHHKLDMERVMEVLASYNRLAYKLIRLSARNVPPVMTDSIVFAYITGSNFVSFLYRNAGGWSGVNDAYKHVPASTEEVLFPDKYIKKTDPPRRVVLAVSPRLFGDDWVLLERNTLGELGIFSLMRRFIPPRMAKKASVGWGGDRYVVVGSRGGKSTLWVWVTEWDTVADAAEFYDAYRLLLTCKYKDIQDARCPVEEGSCWKTRTGELVWMKRSGCRVSVVEGADGHTLPAAVKYTAPHLIAGRPPLTPPGRRRIPVSASIVER